MRRAAIAASVAIASLAAGASAQAATQPVSVQFAAFGPAQLDVLPGETVLWSNVSERRHTVTSDTGLFASGDLFGADRFSWTFSGVGAYPYHCTVHAGMVGEIDVRRVTLGTVPTAVIPAGTRVDMAGRTANATQPVLIERSADGTHFATVAKAIPAPDGTWYATVTATETGYYRARSGSDVSEQRRVLVSNRRVKLRATRRGVVATVTPSAPYAHVALQVRKRERFGWWTTARARLDYLSQARFRVSRPARVRVLLLDADGWTALARSRVVVLARR
jgi:plastocyanin